MKISELIERLNKAKEKVGDIEIGLSIDEEGNDFKDVWKVQIPMEGDGDFEAGNCKKYKVVIFP